MRQTPSMPEGNRGLQQAVTETGDLRPVRDLEQTGIERVRVVSQSQLADLMSVAVNRALRQELDHIDLSPADLERLRRRTEQEYSRLLHEGLEIPQAEPPVADPKADLPREKPISEELASFESRMVNNLSQLLEKDWRAGLLEVQQNHRQQMGLLEKRISKLVDALESTDRALEHLQSESDQPEAASAGMRSGGSRGQGLDPAGPLFQKKSELLSALFEANKQLRVLESEAHAAD